MVLSGPSGPIGSLMDLVTWCVWLFLIQVKVLHLFLDEVAISPPDGFLVRKGPGNCHFDFAQEILFVDYLQPPADGWSHDDAQRHAAQRSPEQGKPKRRLISGFGWFSEAVRRGRSSPAWTTKLPSCLVAVSFLETRISLIVQNTNFIFNFSIWC